MDRLDQLLEDARPLEPTDDGFTLRVMDRVRMDPVPIRRRGRRFFTRPIVLAAAAVLVTGGALAAVSTVTDPGPAPSAAPAPEEAELRVNGRPSPREGTTSADEPRVASSAAAGDLASEGRVWRDGAYEWGYTSDHTAYVVDHANGLRLETETYSNTATAGAPQKVTVTLTNVGDGAIGIYSPDGCALAVAAFRPSEDASGGTAFDPTEPQDASGEAWRCAGTDTRTGEQAQKWVLPAGSSRTRDAEIILGGAGDWTVFGTCRCKVVSPNDDGDTDPLGHLTQFTFQLPTDLRPRGDASSPDGPAGHALVTPPIRVRAS